MARSWKVWTSLMVVVVLLLATSSTLAAPNYFYKAFGYFPSVLGRFPKRNEFQYPLPGLLPRDTEELWHGYDEEGFSRNGRDVSHQMPALTNTLAM